ATFELRVPIVQFIWWHNYDLPMTHLMAAALILELLRAMRDQTEVKVQMVVPLKSKLLVFRLDQAQLIMVGCVVLNLFHY
ncbi:hypothetical protein OFN49_38775, partial [Escherichia coli]|nr:hypothetical protein [Escherichia coli]